MRIDKPLTQEQLKQGDLIPPGIYDFQVINAEETTSKAGNEMMKLQLTVWDEKGRERTIYDYLLESLEWKVGHFAEATGLFDNYVKGMLPADMCIGKSGQCKVYIQQDKTGTYGDKNSIADYIPTSEAIAAKADKKANNSKSVPDLNDDIPF